MFDLDYFVMSVEKSICSLGVCIILSNLCVFVLYLDCLFRLDIANKDQSVVLSELDIVNVT